MTNGGSENLRCFWCQYGDANKEGFLSHNKVKSQVNRLCSVESIAVLILLCATCSVLYIHKTLKQKNFSSHRPTLYLIFPHTLSVLPKNSFKPLSKRFSFPSFLSSHPHTQFPSATSILNTTDTFCCFQIVVVRHPSCSIS